MALSNDAKNVCLDALGVLGVKLALLNDSQVELSGGSPAYARKTISWGAAAAGSMAMVEDPVFDIPAAGVVSYVQLWNTGGTVSYGIFDVANETYTGQGTYTLTAFTINLNK